MRRPRFGLALAFVALVALGIRIAFVVFVDPKVPPVGDASAYHLLAEQLARGDGYIRPFDNLLLHRVRPTAEYPPLFPLVLAIPARLGIHGVESQRIFCAFVGATTVTLIGLLGRRVGGPAVGITAAVLAACSPMLFQSEGMLMAEALYVPLVVGVLLLTYRTFDAPTPARFAVLGFAIALATLTPAEGLLLGLLLIVGLCVAIRLPARDRLARRRGCRGGSARARAVDDPQRRALPHAGARVEQLGDARRRRELRRDIQGCVVGIVA